MDKINPEMERRFTKSKVGLSFDEQPAALLRILKYTTILPIKITGLVCFH